MAQSTATKRQRTESGHAAGGGASNQQDVRAHYNARKDMGRDARKGSPIFRLKAFNNWIKSVLISEYVAKAADALYAHTPVAAAAAAAAAAKRDGVDPRRRRMTVLDISCGKGGDLQKWVAAGIGHLFAADHAGNSVRDALNRYNDLKWNPSKPQFPASFIVADCHSADLTGAYGATTWFDVVSCQFSFHYCFESEARARGMLWNISAKLKTGGYFIGTTPDADVLIKQYRASSNGRFANEHFAVAFDLPPTPTAAAAGAAGAAGAAAGAECPQSHVFDRTRPFGQKYWFDLSDAIDHCAEYLVPFDALQALALDYDLELVERASLHDFFAAHCATDEHERLLRTVKVVDAQTGDSLSKAEWEVAYLYQVFVFRKRAPQAAAPAADDGKAAAAAAAPSAGAAAGAKRKSVDPNAHTMLPAAPAPGAAQGRAPALPVWDGTHTPIPSHFPKRLTYADIVDLH